MLSRFALLLTLSRVSAVRQPAGLYDYDDLAWPVRCRSPAMLNPEATIHS